MGEYCCCINQLSEARGFHGTSVFLTEGSILYLWRPCVMVQTCDNCHAEGFPLRSGFEIARWARMHAKFCDHLPAD